MLRTLLFSPISRSASVYFRGSSARLSAFASCKSRCHVPVTFRTFSSAAEESAGFSVLSSQIAKADGESSRNVTKKPNKDSIHTWNMMLQQLKQYKAEHGDCMVPYRDANQKKTSPLGAWVSRQRNQYRCRMEGKPSNMTNERLEALEELGFDWVAKRKTKEMAGWDEMVQELKEYKEEHGDCLVPQNDPDYSMLAKWIKQQRRNYKRKEKGKSSSLTDENIAALEELGFDWIGGPDETEKITWEERLDDLARYKNEHGDCLVPSKDLENKEDASLGRWVNCQRRQYKQFMAGKRSSLTDDRIAALEELGFVWSVKSTREISRKSWDKWLNELKQYKAEHGDCYVPFAYGPLGWWVARQRTQYKSRSSGRLTALTDEKVAQLEDLGFEWVMPKSKNVTPKSWDACCDELKEYKANYGHCRPDRNTGHEALAEWVFLQRRQYRRWREGKTSSMTPARIAALLELEFEWDSEPGDNYRRVLGGNWDPFEPLAWTNDFGGRSAESEERLKPLVQLKPGDNGYFDVSDVTVPNVSIVRTKDQARVVLERLMNADPELHACDVEVMEIDLRKEGPVGNGYVTCMTVYSGPGFDYGLGDGPGTVLWIDNLDYSYGLVGEFKEWLESEKYLKIWHNFGFRRHLLWNEGIDCMGFGGDTMHMARLQDTSRASHGHRMGYSLDGLVYELVNRKKPSMKHFFGDELLQNAEGRNTSRMTNVPPVEVLQRDPMFREKWIAYSSSDAKGIWQIQKKLQENLEKMPWMGGRNMYDCYSMHLRPFGVVLTDMERRGIRLDKTNFMSRVEDGLRKDREGYLTTFRKWACSKIGPDGWGVNPDDPEQLRGFLFGNVQEVVTFKVAVDEFPFAYLNEMQLRLLCKKRGLDVSGQKVDLLERLGLSETTARRIIEQSADAPSLYSDITTYSNINTYPRRLQERKWNKRLEELRQYEKEHGNCRVDEQKHPSLGKWVKNQRFDYWRRAEGKISSMTNERIAALEHLGFEWTVEGANFMHWELWNERFMELKQWKDKHGHCIVPESRNNKYFSLGVWNTKQRQQYRLWKAGKPSILTHDRIAALNELGFEWEVSKGPSKTLQNKRWNNRLEELRHYKIKHGNTRVPMFENKSKKYLPLGGWVNTQKQQYRLRKEGKPSTLTDERVMALLGLGCEWIEEDLHDFQNKVDVDNWDNREEPSKHLDRYESLASSLNDFFDVVVPSLGLSPERLTASGEPSVDVDVLRKLAGNPFRDSYGTAYDFFGGGKEGHDACVALHSLCTIDGIDRSVPNFWTHLEPLTDDQSRVHCSLNLHTETGRVSARRPNLQNQPPHLIRQAFHASPGNKLIVANYHQLEHRLLASMAGCKSMIKLFREGHDFHSRTALDIFGYVKEQVKEGHCLTDWNFTKGEPPKPLLKDVFADERQKAKELNFSIISGDASAAKISRLFGVSERKAEKIIRAWNKSYPEVLDWQNERKDFGMKYGIARTLMGRYRHLPKVKGGKLPAPLERASVTTPIEGGAADVAMLAMLKLNNSDLLKRLGWVLLMQMNNEVVLEGPQETAKEAFVEVIKCMEEPWEFGLSETKVPLVVDGSCRYETWYEAN